MSDSPSDEDAALMSETYFAAPSGAADGYPEYDWVFMARSIMAETPTSVALEALDGAIARLQPLHRDDIRPAFAALAEGTWWVAAIDERLMMGFGGMTSERAKHYRHAREQSSDGQFVGGLLWARDRHTHQLPFSMDHDDTPFFGSDKGFLYISSGFIWRESAEMLEPPKPRRSGGSRKTYDALLAGKSAWKSLERCSRWFHTMAGHENS